MKIEDLHETAIDLITASSIWTPASVKDEPHTRLSQWSVFLVEGLDGDDEKTIHFVGYTGYEGRVCSAVVEYDSSTKRGVTRSGRVYSLEGPSGINSDAVYVWNRWCRINNVDKAEDITDTFENE